MSSVSFDSDQAIMIAPRQSQFMLADSKYVTTFTRLGMKLFDIDKEDECSYLLFRKWNIYFEDQDRQIRIRASYEMSPSKSIPTEYINSRRWVSELVVKSPYRLDRQSSVFEKTADLALKALLEDWVDTHK